MQYIINGGGQLKGTIALSGAKNVALKLIIAALLCEGKSEIKNVPKIRDIEALVEIINYLGGEVKFIDNNTITVENKLYKYEIPLELAARTRVSFMLIAPLLWTFKKVSLPNPGGCRLGERPVDRMVKCLNNFGAEVEYFSDTGFYEGSLSEAKATTVTFAKKSHTGTELALMFASRIVGQSRIKNAALEPEIDDLISFLNSTGAKVERSGQDIFVTGKSKLNAGKQFVQYDRNEAVSYIVLAALFNGQIKVKNVDPEMIASFLTKFKDAGFQYSYLKKERLFTVLPAKQILPVDVETKPHPGFMTDWQPLWALLMLYAQGESKIHETVFENRFGYVSQLHRMGGKIQYYHSEVADPRSVYQFNNFTNGASLLQAIKIFGPTALHNGVVTVTDLRAGACLVFAALLAKGKTIVNGAEQIERGYENLVDKLTQLGAKIKTDSSFC